MNKQLIPPSDVWITIPYLSCDGCLAVSLKKTQTINLSVIIIMPDNLYPPLLLLIFVMVDWPFMSLLLNHFSNFYCNVLIKCFCLTIHHHLLLFHQYVVIILTILLNFCNLICSATLLLCNIHLAKWLAAFYPPPQY